MSFETDLRARLKAATAAGVHWDSRPQGSSLPAVVLSMIAGSRDKHMAGVISTQGPRVQATCFAANKKAAAELRDEIMPVLEGIGAQGGTTFIGGFVNFYTSRVDNTATGEVFSVIIDANIWFH